MASSTSEGPLEELLVPVVAQSGLELDSVIRPRSDAVPLLRIIVEAPIGAGGINSDTLTEVSRAVSKTLGAVDPIDGEHLLEISTPGARREFTRVRHWMRQIGRLVRTKLRAGGYVSERVVVADETSTTIGVNDETAIIDYQDMRKACSRVDFGSRD